jgi:hypothetical protein
MITTFIDNHSTNQVQAPLSWLQVHHSHTILSQPNNLGNDKGLYKEEGKVEAKTHNRMKNLG